MSDSSIDRTAWLPVTMLAGSDPTLKSPGQARVGCTVTSGQVSAGSATVLLP